MGLSTLMSTPVKGGGKFITGQNVFLDFDTTSMSFPCIEGMVMTSDTFEWVPNLLRSCLVILLGQDSSPNFLIYQRLVF